MPCETARRPNQTFTERKVEVRTAISRLAAELVSGRAKPVIDRATGAIAFSGTTTLQDGRVSDACCYRMTLATGSALAKQAIARAEQLAGRTVSRQALTNGVHSHDGGRTFHRGH